MFASLLTGGFAWLIRWYPEQEANQYVRVILDKEARLRATTSARLLLVGGSNCALGVDSSALERALQRPVINLGITVEFGREFILNQAAAHVRKDDIVVVSLEYFLFTNAAPNGQPLSVALEAMPSTWRYMGIHQWKAVLDGGLLQLGFIARTSLANLRGHYHPAINVYRRDAFNLQGDMTSHHGIPATLLPSRPVNVSESSLRDTLDLIARFVAHCRAQGATVYFELPPWPENWVQAQPAILERIYRGLREVPGLVVLNTPATIALPDDVFFDSEYHPTQDGTALRTQRLIQSLSAARAQ